MAYIALNLRKCSECNGDMFVTETRTFPDYIRRRFHCKSCGNRETDKEYLMCTHASYCHFRLSIGDQIEGCNKASETRCKWFEYMDMEYKPVHIRKEKYGAL